MRPALLAPAAALALLAACGTDRAAAPGGGAGGGDVPAVIVEPTDASRAQLAAAVSAALLGARVTLAPDALTGSSVLSVERTRLRDPSGLPAVGRDLGLPERFQLVKRGGACVLQHEGSGREVVLEATRCVPARR